MVKIAFIAKTNLNNDGRILNELKIIRNKFKENICIDFILLADKPLTIKVDEVDELHNVTTNIRNNAFLRFLTVIEFTIKTLRLLIKLKPDVVHAQDLAVVLPVFIYKLFKRNKVKIIYDDHELPNANDPLEYKLFQIIEKRIICIADAVIVANEERLNYLRKNISCTIDNIVYFLNLPYFENENSNETFITKEVLAINDFKSKNSLKFIMHQGIIEIERGRVKLAEISRVLPEEVKIMIVGVSKEYFKEFLIEFQLNKEDFYFIGSVPYNVLNEYWKLADASIVMYLPNFLNNRLCAPNRLYISFLNNLPIIVNKDNPVLSNFVNKHKCGMFIEDLHKENISNMFRIEYTNAHIEKLIQTEIIKFQSIYSKVLEL